MNPLLAKRTVDFLRNRASTSSARAVLGAFQKEFSARPELVEGVLAHLSTVLIQAFAEEADPRIARCTARGVEREVSLFLLQDQDVAPGEFVVVHVGYAIQKITPQEARSAWELYDLMLGGEEARDA